MMIRPEHPYQKWIFALLFLLAAVFVLSTYRLGIQGFFNQFVPAPYHEEDQGLVDAALRVAAGPTGNVESLRKATYPVVVEFEDRKCVGLNPRRGVYGRAQTVCFSRRDSSVVEHYLEDGEPSPTRRFG